MKSISRSRQLPGGRDGDLDAVTANACFERAWGPARHRTSVVQDHDLVSKLIGLFEVLGREDERRPVARGVGQGIGRPGERLARVEQSAADLDDGFDPSGAHV